MLFKLRRNDFFFYLLSLVSLVLVLSPLSPVKLRATLIVVRSLLFLEIYVAGSRMWIAGIFIIIFIGGIIVIFIIVTSLLPNEKNLKVKRLLLLSCSLIVLIGRVTFTDLQVENYVNQRSKIVFFSNERFEVLIIVIILYFFSFLMIVTKETSTLRSRVC